MEDKAEEYLQWLENSWNMEEILQLGLDSYNEIHKGEFTYNINYIQYRQMCKNKLNELYGGMSVGGGFAQTPYPFKDPSEST